MEEYIKEFTIPYYDCNASGLIRPVSLLEYLVETSSLHSDSLGLGFKEMLKKNYAWLLSRWKIEIFTYPKAREKIKIKTWASQFDKFYANREFNIYDKDENLIAEVSTLWVFMHTKRKRPIRIPDEMYNKFNIIDNKNFNEFFNFNNELKMESSMDFRVRKTDIDSNDHVNNAKYLNWFLETIPLEVDEKYLLKELDIYYIKEIKYDNIIESKLSEKEKVGEAVQFFHRIYNKESGELTTKCKSVWKKE